MADSQLLFWSPDKVLFLQRIPDLFAPDEIGASLKAAYIGASNGDMAALYELFVAAMEGIDVVDGRMLPVTPSAEDRAYLATAQIIV